MTARLYASIGALIALMIVSAPAPQPAHAKGHGGPPALVSADHFDVSRPLRELPRRAPQAGFMHEAPSFRHATGPKMLDPVVQSTPAPSLLAGPSLSFEGISNLNGVLPPDTEGAIGPNHYVQWVNLSFAVYQRGPAGSTPTLIYGPVAGNTLWTGFGGPCETTNNGDPVVRYDQLADRWFVSQLALPNAYFGLYFAPFYQCIAVSATPDPTGPYYRYQYSFQKLNDYPKFGVWPDAYYMTMNQFNPPLLGYAGQGVVAFDRLAMLQGRPANMVYFDLASVDINLGGMLPSDVDGVPPPAGSPNFYMEVDDDAWGFPQDQLELWKFHVDWTTPSNSTFTQAALMPTAAFDSNLCGGSQSCVPQPGTTELLDTLSDRLMYRLQYRNFGDHESLVVNHTVDVDGTDHAGIRWYEVRDPNGLPWIYQQGTYAPDADHRWMGSAAMDSAGNMAIGFSVSSATTYPSIRYAARLATDPLGTLGQGETTLIAGSGSQTHTADRWGDYSMMTVDPTDGCTFWYTQQYYATTSLAGWQTRIGAFSLPSCGSQTSSQSGVSVLATIPTAMEAGLVQGQFTISRKGDTSAPLTVAYTVTGTATPGADYVPLDISATIPAGAASVTIPVVPIDDTLVEPDETVILTLVASPDYTLGSPASAIVRIVSDDLPPDLVVSAVSVPATGGANLPISITDTTLNQGKGPADVSVTTYYLSTNTTLDSSDVALGSRTVPQLAAGASSAATTTLTIPANTTGGTYYVIAVADATNTNAETSETNNTKASAAIKIGPDLVVSALTVPTVAGAGFSISVTDTTTNSGAGDAPASNTGFYISTKAFFDTSATWIGFRAAGPLPVGAASSGTTPVVIPAGTATGIYYIIAVADYDKQVGETNETNNTRASGQLRVGPDLVESAASVTPIAGSGGPITVNDTVKNQGVGDAGASTTGFYLSTSAVFNSTTATRLGSRSVPALPAGTSNSASTPVTLPTGLATGTYFVFAYADDTNVVVESFETNNASTAQSVKIGPDLIVSAFAPPSTMATGVSVNVNSTVLNQGGGAAPQTTVRFYLSVNLTVDASDIVVGSRTAGPLAPGQSDTGVAAILIPSGTAAGSYWLIAVADDGNAVPETNESNNTRAGLVKVTVGSGQ
jgi:subtilase family serine protease